MAANGPGFVKKRFAKIEVCPSTGILRADSETAQFKIQANGLIWQGEFGV
ncbi:hypothetical protein F2S88_00725 [Pseudomonas syringae pv. actinidiae]|nr:hypothetical protein [Pseudomonas syringae pv. actinidiae]